MNKGNWIIAGAVAGVALLLYATGRRKKSFLGIFNTAPSNPNILFIGDSLTATERNGRPTGTYPSILQSRRPDLRVDALAKGGQTTSWMLQNLPIKLNALNARKYGKVFIHGGINDAFTEHLREDTTISNMQKMIDAARSNGARAYVILGYEPEGFMDWRKMPTTRYVRNREQYKPVIEKWKRLQLRYQRELRNATIIPKISLSANMTSDGIHPNGQGQARFADAVQRYL